MVSSSSSSSFSSSSVREMEKVVIMGTLHTNGGVGETSYAKNSDVQGNIIKMAKHILEEAIVKSLYNKEGNIPKSFGIADLGCSSGPNTLTVVSDIIDTMHAKCADMGCQLPELRVSLNDLPTNDFNNVFESLPEFYRKLRVENGMDSSSCFISGVPGSFYGRLFPRESLHFVHSSSSLHWLSQVPPRIMNKGHIYIAKGSPEGLFEAYAEQFDKDFRVFLESRSLEMVRGGRMVLSLMGRTTHDPTTESAYLWDLLAQALLTLASEGLVEEEKVHSFNAPYYAPCADELLNLIHKDGSFDVDCIETFGAEWDCYGAQLSPDDDSDSFYKPELLKMTRGERVGKMVRAVVESLIEYHFGMDIMDVLFDRFAMLAQDHLMKYRTKNTVVVVSLLRK